MRFFPLLLLVGLLRTAVAQTGSGPDSQQSLFSSQVPDATITISKHPMGADMVEVTMTAPGYPPRLLGAQLKALGKYLHSDPRGLEVYDYVLDPSNPNSHYTKAQFAVDGVLDRKLGSVRLNPFAKAFAGAAKPWTLHALNIMLQGEVPTDNMIKVWRSKSATLEGRYDQMKDPKLAGIEFRIQLLSQDPAKLDIPEPGDAPVSTSKKKVDAPGTDWATIAVFLVAAAALGALVYSLLLRSRPKARI